MKSKGLRTTRTLIYRVGGFYRWRIIGRYDGSLIARGQARRWKEVETQIKQARKSHDEKNTDSN